MTQENTTQETSEESTDDADLNEEASSSEQPQQEDEADNDETDASSEEETPEPNKDETIEDDQATFSFDEESETAYDSLVTALKDCYDPEIPVNLYDLGLIHEVRVTGREVNIDMTLTAPGCGFGPQIAKNVEMRMVEEDTIDEASVEIVHDPPWDRDMVSEEGQAQLNMLGF
jgi:metal-sulfur cluster biosynthetic enzyme